MFLPWEGAMDPQGSSPLSDANAHRTRIRRISARLCLGESRSASMSQRCLSVVCPANVKAGDPVNVTTETGESFEVELPDGISEGDVFHVHVSSGKLHASTAADMEASGGLAAISAEMAAARAIVAEFFGGDPDPVENAEVLAEALKSILRAIEDDESIHEFIEGNSSAFARYSPQEEHALEWSSLHAAYVILVEAAIQEHLDELACSAEEVALFAQQHGLQDTVASHLLDKFIAMSDQEAFFGMMRAAYEVAG